ncbi:MAG: MFS transporter [Firmicutes bacterium]|nr:MFS transporter [Bacillota bacterium]
MFVHGGVQAFLLLFAAQRGIVHAGLFFTIYSLIGLGSRIFVGRAGDRFGIRTVTLPSLFVLAVGLFFLGAARSLSALILASVIYGLGFAAVNPLVAAMVAGAVRDSEKGAALGFQGAGKDVGIALGGPLLGLLIAPLGYGGTFLTAGLIMVGVALGMSVLLPRRDPSGRVDPGSGHAVGS